MPKFQDNSYVLRDVESLQRDVNIYHNQNQKQLYEKLKKMCLDRELDTYDLLDKLINDLKSKFNEKLEKLNQIWEEYRKIVDKKQFFVREPVTEITSIESLLDKCNKKMTNDREIIHQFMKESFSDFDVEENEYYMQLIQEDYSDSRMKPFYREYQDFVLEDLSHKYEKLYKNFTGIFFKTVNRTMDMERLRNMLNMVKNVERNNITQHNASVKIGKELGKQYLKDFK